MDLETRYQQTLEYLYRFVDYSLTRNLQVTPETFNLNRMRSFMEYLGHPEKAYPLIHVAGTKGKGSVAALCASALRAEGYSTGFYSSPHLEDYAERIQVDGQPVAHADLIALVDEIRPALEGPFSHITTFEITTALAFLYFARCGVDAVVAEVGLGGRLDATNVIIPRVSVITSLSLDHTSILGNTLAEIAAEKAGIIKPGVPVVLAPQSGEARQVVVQIAAERGAPLIQVGHDFQFTRLDSSLQGQTFQVWPVGSERAPVQLAIPLLGLHQIENAATAYIALLAWRDSGMRLTDTAIREGFARVFWPGRFEILRDDPPVVVDCAHNRDSAQRLSKTVQEFFPNHTIVLIFGSSEDKDINGMLGELLGGQLQVGLFIATRSYHPRAAESGRLLELAQHYDIPSREIPAVEDALAEALRLVDSGEINASPYLILATGSIFVVAGVRETWYKQASGCVT